MLLPMMALNQTAMLYYTARVEFIVLFVSITLQSSELIKVEDVKTHICAIFLRIRAKFVLLNAKQEKLGCVFLKILGQFVKFL